MTCCFPANLRRQSVRPDGFTLFIFLLVSPGGRKSHLQELCFSARPLKKLGLNEEKNLPHICTYTLPFQGCIRLVLAASTLCRQGSGMMELEGCFLCPDLQLFVCKAPAKSYPRSRRVQSAGGKKRGERALVTWQILLLDTCSAGLFWTNFSQFVGFLRCVNAVRFWR